MGTAAAAIALVMLAGSCSGSYDEAPARKGCPATVHVFVVLGATRQRQDRIGQVIDNAPGVLEWSFHSNLEAYREFKRLYKKEPKIYEAKEPSDFPARFEVTLDSTSTFGLFERALEGATTGIDRLVPGGCATEAPPT